MQEKLAGSPSNTNETALLGSNDLNIPPPLCVILPICQHVATCLAFFSSLIIIKQGFDWKGLRTSSSERTHVTRGAVNTLMSLTSYTHAHKVPSLRTLGKLVWTFATNCLVFLEYIPTSRCIDFWFGDFDLWPELAFDPVLWKHTAASYKITGSNPAGYKAWFVHRVLIYRSFSQRICNTDYFAIAFLQFSNSQSKKRSDVMLQFQFRINWEFGCLLSQTSNHKTEDTNIDIETEGTEPASHNSSQNIFCMFLINYSMQILHHPAGTPALPRKDV